MADFLTNWLEHGAPVKSPKILRLWAGIGVISCILSRRVWTRANSRYRPLYPNTYILLLAEPGGGKDVAIDMAEDICLATNALSLKRFGHSIMNSGLTSVSPKGLLDALSEDKSEQVLSLTTNTKQETIKFKSVSLFLREATTSIPEYNQLLIGILNELYMCKNRYGEKIRGFEYSIENPHLFILMGNQPATFYKVFPLSASSTGIMARIVSVYNSGVVTGVKTWLDPEDEQILDNSLWDSCTEHLLEISTWAGQLKTTRDFRQAINLFEETNPAPVPGERFKEWNSRRSLNLAKISICLAASEKEQIISSHHWDRALEYVFEIEARMPDAFLNIITDRGFSEELDNIPQLAGPEGVITQYKLLTKLSRTRPPHEAAIIIDQAVKSGLLNIVYDEAGTPKKPTIYSIHPSEALGKTIQ